MNKKIPLGLVIGIMCIIIAVTSIATYFAVTNNYNSVLKDLPQKLDRYEVLDELDKIINNNYYGSNSEEDLERAIANGYISGLGDNYSVLLTAKEYDKYIAQSQGDKSGIGIEYTKSKNQIKITDVYEDSPAYAAGLEENDVIVALDGIMINASNYKESVAKLEDDKLSSINLTYRRNKEDTTINVMMGYEAKSVFAKTYGNIGYIKITSFYSKTASQVSDEVNKFTSSGVSGLVIDVRNNSSTNYDYAMEVLDVFVPINDSLPAASIVDENGNTIVNYNTKSGEVNLPIAVLINSGTKASAELFACDMRDFSKADLVGEATNGIGLKRDVFKLSNGDAILLSVGIVKPYRSEIYNETGLTPDVDVELEKKTKDISQDSQFLAAVSHINPA